MNSKENAIFADARMNAMQCAVRIMHERYSYDAHVVILDGPDTDECCGIDELSYTETYPRTDGSLPRLHSESFYCDVPDFNHYGDTRRFNT